MKKLFVAAAVALFVLGFASCKGECECAWKDGSTTYDTTTHGNLSKADCKALEKTLNIFGDETIKCSIK